MKRSHILLAVPCLLLILSSAPAASSRHEWKRELSLGMNVSRGNTESRQAKAKLMGSRKAANQGWDMAIEGTYAETDETTQAENARAFLKYSDTFSERFFASGRASIDYDRLADLDYRLVLGPALGYYMVKTEKTTLSAEVGPSLIREKIAGQGETYVAPRFAQRLEHAISTKSKLWQQLEYLPDMRSNGRYLLNSEVGISADINDKFTLKFTVESRYDSIPAEDKEKSDLSIVSAIAYRF